MIIQAHPQIAGVICSRENRKEESGTKIGPKSERSRAEQPIEIQDTSVAWREETRIDRFKKTCHGKPFQATFTQLDDYCGNSTLHGVRYFAERKRHWFERVWWIVGCLVSLWFCGVLVNNVYDNWHRKSIILSFAEAQTPVWDIPFPAVTICPSTIVQFENFKFQSFDEMLPNITEREFKILSAFNNICGPYDQWTGIFENLSEKSIIDFIGEIAPSYNYTVMNCFFPSNKYNCELEIIMTDMGVCFTFNMLNSKETYSNESSGYLQIHHNKRTHWNLENGYDSKIKRNSQTYPYRAFSFRDQLYVKLQTFQPYLNNTCYEKGHYIVLHTPGEIPQIKNNFLNLPIFELAYLSVTPRIITTSQRLRAYSPDRRQCYFDSERKLRFLKVYTQRNCELECLSNFTLSYCGCVDFYMLRDANTPICGPAKKACCLRAVEYSANGATRQAQDITEEEDMTEEEITRINELVEQCNCLPACTSISYEFGIIKCDAFKEINKTELRKHDDQVSKLNVYFKENEYITLTRSEIYGTVDFIANSGGLIGLFTGASFLSIVELLYYCSLRLCCNRIRRRKRERENKISTVLTVSTLIMDADTKQAFQLALKHDEATRNETSVPRLLDDSTKQKYFYLIDNGNSKLEIRMVPWHGSGGNVFWYTHCTCLIP